MPTLLVIDSDIGSRHAIHAAAPSDWTVLEAATGMIGLDSIRQYGTRLDLIVLDPQLPDLEGRLLCAQIRLLFPSVPVLPITHSASALPLLTELGCLPPLTKPATYDDLTQRLCEAVTATTSAPIRSAMLHLIYEQAIAAEQQVRQGQYPLRVLVYASSPIKRAGLTQLLGSMALIDTAEQPGALRRALAQARYQALVTVTDDSVIACDIGNPYALPMILVAPTVQHALQLRTANVVGIVMENDPAAAIHFQHLLEAIRAGDPRIESAYSDTLYVNVPPGIAQRFANTPLTRREVETLWLDAQGWSGDQIAQHLSIERTTVNSHWKRIQRKLHLPRDGVRSWVHAQLACDARAGQPEPTDTSC